MARHINELPRPKSGKLKLKFGVVSFDIFISGPAFTVEGTKREKCCRDFFSSFNSAGKLFDCVKVVKLEIIYEHLKHFSGYSVNKES